jgi:acyl-CoA thioester hydrolase
MGFLYYGNYALYYEVGRTQMIRELGLSYKEMETAGILMPVTDLKVKYIRPALYDDLITVKTMLKEWPNQKIVFDSALYNEQGELLNIGATTLVFLDAVTRKKLPDVPDILADRLRPYF